MKHLSLALFALACGAADPAPEPFDPIEDAASLWTDAVGVTLADFPPHEITFKDVVECNGGTRYFGCTKRLKDGETITKIDIRTDIEGELLRTVLAHEFGHLIGLRGWHQPDSLMASKATPGAPITEPVAEAVCSAGVVPCRWFNPTDEWRPLD